MDGAEAGAALVAVVGPTAAGKSDAALGLCEALDGELLSCDALQLRQGLPILTAKPDAATRQRVPHHLIDVLPLTQPGTAARYAELADEAIRAIRGRGKVVVLCGGTGLYLRALVHGIFAGPPADWGFRAALRAEAEARGVAALHRRLQGVDAAAAARISAADYVRIERALEVFAATGVPISRLQEEGRLARPRYRVVGVGLDPGEALRGRIQRRAAQMIAAGLCQEVAAVAAAQPELLAPPLGYEAVCRHLRGAQTQAELVQELAGLTIKYAKRQRTWFRKEPGLRWCQAPSQIPVAALREALHALAADKDPEEAYLTWQRR